MITRMPPLPPFCSLRAAASKNIFSLCGCTTLKTQKTHGGHFSCEKLTNQKTMNSYSNKSTQLVFHSRWLTVFYNPQKAILGDVTSVSEQLAKLQDTITHAPFSQPSPHRLYLCNEILIACARHNQSPARQTRL